MVEQTVQTQVKKTLPHRSTMKTSSYRQQRSASQTAVERGSAQRAQSHVHRFDNKGYKDHLVVHDDDDQRFDSPDAYKSTTGFTDAIFSSGGKSATRQGGLSLY